MSDVAEAPAAIGHNLPPVVTDEDIAALIYRRDELLAAFNRFDAVVSDATAQKATELCKELTALCNAVEELRTKAKAPSIEEGRKVDAKFKAISEPAAKLIPHVKEPLRVFMYAHDLDQVRSELGALASLQTTTTFENLDRRKLDLEKLRDHLPIDALEKAVRSFIKAGGSKIRGVKIVERKSVTVR
jgi:hypothetical protein